ncbi:SDR family NAD(P)-dependent oxidoreductase [Rhizomonospora bruguierae]|uniref:SDR family NAD(P)-dependent oxidoreductase n=1 Tax=Rhizomonospora bruguierae TaxID=1581705 RepID=UPI001BCB2845|nr:SDR family NAD(P)-dependent oxidoreductase [Micromonospora sp. NBRC 107566]
MTSRTVLITGASSGIGARTAELLAARGDLRVFGAARRTTAIEAISGVTAVALDLNDKAGPAAAVRAVAEAAGPVDILINCAGYGEFGSVEETSVEDARTEMEINVFGAVQLIQAVLPGMREQRAGRIVNMSSLAGEFAAPLGGWYHASKFALEALSDALRGEVAQFGIDVALVQPSYVATDWHETAMTRLIETSGQGPYAKMAEAMRAFFTGGKAAKQMCTVDEVAKVTVKAALDAKPKTRYRVGKGANVAVAMATMLPDRTFDNLTRLQFGYPKSA